MRRAKIAGRISYAVASHHRQGIIYPLPARFSSRISHAMEEKRTSTHYKITSCNGLTSLLWDTGVRPAHDFLEASYKNSRVNKKFKNHSFFGNRLDIRSMPAIVSINIYTYHVNQNSPVPRGQGRKPSRRPSSRSPRVRPRSRRPRIC